MNPQREAEGFICPVQLGPRHPLSSPAQLPDPTPPPALQLPVEGGEPPLPDPGQLLLRAPGNGQRVEKKKAGTLRLVTHARGLSSLIRGVGQHTRLPCLTKSVKGSTEITCRKAPRSDKKFANVRSLSLCLLFMLLGRGKVGRARRWGHVEAFTGNESSSPRQHEITVNHVHC